MSTGSNCLIGMVALSSLACLIGACQSGGKGSSGNAAVKANPAPLQARAKLPPPPTAIKRSSIGSGATAVQTANTPGDTDSYWVEQFDIDGDGTVERTEFLWDDEDKVLFAYSETDVPCSSGGMAVVAFLGGVNGAGNTRGRAPGSGFFAASLDAMECGATAAGVFGCRFDATGYATEWAAVVVDSDGDEIDMVGEN